MRLSLDMELDGRHTIPCGHPGNGQPRAPCKTSHSVHFAQRTDLRIGPEEQWKMYDFEFPDAMVQHLGAVVHELLPSNRAALLLVPGIQEILLEVVISLNLLLFVTSLPLIIDVLICMSGFLHQILFHVHLSRFGATMMMCPLSIYLKVMLMALDLEQEDPHNIHGILASLSGPIICGTDFNKGTAEREDEGLVIYFNTYYVSHRTNCRQEGGRIVRLAQDVQQWRQDLQRIWSDMLDFAADFEVVTDAPDPPVTAMRETVGIILIIQHPDEFRAACLTTAWIPDMPDFRVLQMAYSWEAGVEQRHVGVEQRHVLSRGGVLELCDLRHAQGYGTCKIRVGVFEYPADRAVKIHGGLGLFIEVPPPMHPTDWEDYVIARSSHSTSSTRPTPI